MSKMGRHLHGLQEDAAHYWGAMDAARGKTLADFTEEQVNQMVWSARCGCADTPDETRSGSKGFCLPKMLAQRSRAEQWRQSKQQTERRLSNANYKNHFGG